MKLILCIHGDVLLRIGMQYGFYSGKQLPGRVHVKELYFADQDWKKPNRAKYMAALAEHTPHMATIIDWEVEEQYADVMSWAEEAAQYVQQVIIIPKVHGGIPRIPKHINQKDIVLGYSVPTLFGGSETMLQEFKGWPVHLLGGSPHKQMQTFLHLSPIADVITTDGNMASKMCWRGQMWQAGRFVEGPKTGDGKHGLGLFEESSKNIVAAWQQLTTVELSTAEPPPFRVMKSKPRPEKVVVSNVPAEQASLFG